MRRIKEKLSGFSVFEALFLLYFCIFYGHNKLSVMDFDIANALQIIAFLITAGCIIRDYLTKRLGLKSISRFYFIIWYAAFVGYGYLALNWTAEPFWAYVWLDGMLFNAAMLFAVVYYVNSRAKCFRLIRIQLIAMCYMALRLFILLPERRFMGRECSLRYIQELTGFHYNGIAIILSFGIILCVFLFLAEKKWYMLIPVPLFYTVTVLGGSRQGMLIPVAGAIVIFTLVSGIKRPPRIIIVSCLCVAFVVIYILSGIPAPAEMVDREAGTVNVMTGDGSFNERIWFIRAGAELFARSPLVGLGHGAFIAHLIEINYYVLFAYTHFNYIELLLSLGIIGFAIYYSMYAVIAVKAFRRLIKLRIWAGDNISVVFTLSAGFVLLLFECVTVIYWPAHGLTGAVFLFYAYYILKYRDTICQDEKASPVAGS